MVSLVNDTRRLTLGNAQQALAGEDTNLGRETVDYFRKYTPGSNLWWFRAAWDRVLMDNVQRLVDPDAAQHFRRKERRNVRQFGNEYFWAPGDSAPARAPDLTKAFQFEQD